MGLGARALVRRLPVGGPLVRAAVAYAGTRALGDGAPAPLISASAAGVSVRTGS